MAEHKKEDIIAQLEALKDSLGWKVIVKALDENIRDVESQLNGDDGKDLVDPQALALLRAKRNDRIQLRALPDILIREISDTESLPPNLDPYN